MNKAKRSPRSMNDRKMQCIRYWAKNWQKHGNYCQCGGIEWPTMVVNPDGSISKVYVKCGYWHTKNEVIYGVLEKSIFYSDQ